MLSDARNMIAALLISLPLLSAATAQSGSSPFPLRGAEIVHVLQSAGLSVSETQIQSPVGLSTRSASPALKLDRAEVIDNHRLRVRLSCQVSSDCLPFFATVVLDASTSAAGAVAALHSSFHPNVPIGSSAPIIRAGDHATLLIEDGHMRISLPVVSIDTGAEGAQVRVSTLDRKITFRGTVLRAGVVQGDLP